MSALNHIEENALLMPHKPGEKAIAKCIVMGHPPWRQGTLIWTSSFADSNLMQFN